MSIVVDKDLRGNFGPVRDQDPRPTCMAFAASDAHAGVRAGWRPLSVEWAYYHALKRDGGVPHDGTTMGGMLCALRLDGQPHEEGWAYIAELFTDLIAWVPPKANPVFRRESTTLATTFETMTARIDADQPVLFTMSISTAFFRPDSHGIVASAEPLQSRRVHALVAVGLGHRGADRFVLVRNSWGEAWGLNGHAWVETNYLKPRLLRAATMGGDV
jgi:hypothetical protein